MSRDRMEDNLKSRSPPRRHPTTPATTRPGRGASPSFTSFFFVGTGLADSCLRRYSVSSGDEWPQPLLGAVSLSTLPHILRVGSLNLA